MNVIHVHGVDERGKAVLKKQLKRNQAPAHNQVLAVLRQRPSVSDRHGSARQRAPRGEDA
jgi:hypothetical protein